MHVSVPVTLSLRRATALLPPDLGAAIVRTGHRLGAWVVLDATLAGLAVGAATSLALRLWRAPSHLTLALGAAAGVVVAACECWTRRPDAFAAAAALDRALDARDRFLSALHFAVLPARDEAHELQRREVSSFLAERHPIPAPARPSLRAHRVAAVSALAVLASLAAHPVARALSRWSERRAAFAAATPAADTPQAIAARAAALREALRDRKSVV